MKVLFLSWIISSRTLRFDLVETQVLHFVPIFAFVFVQKPSLSVKTFEIKCFVFRFSHSASFALSIISTIFPLKSLMGIFHSLNNSINFVPNRLTDYFNTYIFPVFIWLRYVTLHIMLNYDKMQSFADNTMLNFCRQLISGY